MPSQADNLSLLGFDFGLARIGVATAHLTTGTAMPLTTLSCRIGEPDWSVVSQLIEEWQPDLIVVGTPEKCDENKSLRNAIGRFCTALESRFSVKTTTHDESLSSNEAYFQLKNMRKYQHRKIAKEQIDQLSAAIILQSWIEYRS